MAGRTRLVPTDGLQAAGFPSIAGAVMVADGEGRRCWQLSDYSPNDADRAWIARNLGDVPARPGSDWRNNTWSRES